VPTMDLFGACGCRLCVGDLALCSEFSPRAETGDMWHAELPSRRLNGAIDVRSAVDNACPGTRGAGQGDGAQGLSQQCYATVYSARRCGGGYPSQGTSLSHTEAA
jgi:hypothetical protein